MSLLSKEAERELRKTISQIAKNNKLEIEKDDVKVIVSELIPYMDEMISNRVKEHIKAVAEIVIKNI